MLISLLLLPLNDVTTTYPLTPQYKAIAGLRSGVDYSYSRDNYEKQKKHHPDIAPLPLPLTRAEAFARALQIARDELKWEIIVADENEFHIEAVCTTTLLRFKDDIVIEIREVSPASLTNNRATFQSELHMRSKSRVGKSDLGANAERIRNFFARF